MQINTNTSFNTGVGTNAQITRPDPNPAQRSAAKLVTREAIKPEAPAEGVIDQNERGRLLAKSLYQGGSPRGGLLNILV